jgi:hypothetical protein
MILMGNKGNLAPVFEAALRFKVFHLDLTVF